MEYTVNKSKLTDNTSDDLKPKIAENGDISWQREVNEDDTNVWYYSYSEEDGYGEDSSIAIGDTSQPETNSYINYQEEKGTSVVYEIETDDGGKDIWYWNSELPEDDKTVKLAVSSKDEYNPEVWGEDVVYTYEATSKQRDVYLYNAADDETTKIADDAEVDEYAPHIADEYVIYEGKSGDNSDIYLYDIEEKETEKIADTAKDENNAQLWSNGEVVNVVYEYASASDNKDIRYYDDLTGETIEVADSARNEINPYIAGGYITYQAWDGNDYEIYRYDIEEKESKRLTYNEVDDYNSKVSEDGLVVFEQDYSENEKRVYLYTDKNTLLGSSKDLPAEIKDTMSPEIYGTKVAWQAWDSTAKNWEVWSADLEISDD